MQGKYSLDQRQGVSGDLRGKCRVPPDGFCETVSTPALEAIVAPTLLSRKSPHAHFRNWGGSYHSDVPRAVQHRVYAPSTIEQCVATVELARRGGGVSPHPVPLRALGRIHSPSDLPFSLGWSMRTDELQGVIQVRR